MSSAAVLVVMACTGSEPGGGPEPVTTGAYHHFVTSSLRIPVSPELQREYGLDIDQDPSRRPDNQLGNVFVALTSNSDADLQGVIDASVGAGKTVLLHSVRADALSSDRSVSWQVYRGVTHPQPPRFDGTDAFQVTGNERANEPVLGTTIDGAFDAAGAGALTLELTVADSQPSIALDLIAARVEAEVAAAGCTGKLGGAITQKQLDTVLLPAVVGMMNAAIARDPGCPAACMAGTSAALIIEVFDTDTNGMITLEELRASSLIQTLLAPDLDLLDDSGNTEPDGLEESISFGVGFDCVPATFAVESER